MDEQIAPIRDLALVWAIALFTGQICSRLKQPVIAGYMLGGILLGPHGLKLISNPHQIQMLAEFGVAMLLFTLGLDLSLKQIMSSAKRVFAAGLTQMVLTIATFWLVAAAFNLAPNIGAGFLFGCVCALSSSVVISKVLVDRGEQDSIHGMILIPLSLVQDLCLVLIIPCLPLLAAQNSGSANWTSLLFSVLKAGLFTLVVFFGATKIVPHFLGHFARSNTRELFPLTILVLCLAVALLSNSLGLSLALGAFMAGIMLSQSTYAHQALHDVVPLRDIFSTVFFVSVGMLLDGKFLVENWSSVLIFVFLLIVGKAAIGTIAALFATKNFRSAALVGTGLAQIGEFSFILLTLGYSIGLITTEMYNLFFAGAVVTMMSTPALMTLVPKLIPQGAERPIDEATRHEFSPFSKLQDHVIVCGFGRIGKNLGLVLEAHSIPFVVIELNAHVIESLAIHGTPHIYGDAFSRSVLDKANLRKASCLVLTVPDPISNTGIASLARESNPDVKIIARVHRANDIPILRAAGVNAVVQPEFEASIEITRLALISINRPQAEIAKALEQIKKQRYSLFQTDPEQLDSRFIQMDDDQEGVWFKIQTDSIGGKNLRELDIRRQTGATLTAIKRDKKTIAYPDPELIIEQGDEIFIIGNDEQIRKFEKHYLLPRFSPMSASTSDEISQSMTGGS